jgi:hypothetical protein
MCLWRVATTTTTTATAAAAAAATAATAAIAITTIATTAAALKKPELSCQVPASSSARELRGFLDRKLLLNYLLLLLLTIATTATTAATATSYLLTYLLASATIATATATTIATTATIATTTSLCPHSASQDVYPIHLGLSSDWCKFIRMTSNQVRQGMSSLYVSHKPLVAITVLPTDDYRPSLHYA